MQAQALNTLAMHLSGVSLGARHIAAHEQPQAHSVSNYTTSARVCTSAIQSCCTGVLHVAWSVSLLADRCVSSQKGSKDPVLTEPALF